MLQDQCGVRVSHLGPSASRRPAQRGNLRLFFGGSSRFAGMRAMLETAAASQLRGANVVVCPVNSSRGGAIELLLRGFEWLPALQGNLNATHPPRIDVEAVTKRGPAILLVDTRGPSSGNGRRTGFTHSDYLWADIERILESGISVWAVLDATGFSSWVSVGVGIPRDISGLSLL